MKVLITSPSLDEEENVSGISSLVRSLIEKRAADYVHFEAGRRDGEAANAGWIARQFSLPFRFLAKLRSEKPDLIHLNTAFIPLAIVRDAALAGAASITHVPVLLHIHGGPFVMGEFANGALEAAARGMLKLCAISVVFSRREAESIERRFKVTPRVLPNAIPLDGVIETDRPKGEKTFIFFGRLNRSKGVDRIVDACRDLKAQGFDFKFVCYGAGPEEASFRSKMTKILGDRFSYRGVSKGNTAKWKALSEGDIFFLPSRDEGLPLALLEAMASGCVPVMSASGAVADVIEDGSNGFLINASDTAATVTRLKFLLSESVAGWNELRKNARATVRERYDFADYVARLRALYKEAVSNK
jgi:glycosyltransferase involved in cell wall biosynthesis